MTPGPSRQSQGNPAALIPACLTAELRAPAEHDSPIPNVIFLKPSATGVPERKRPDRRIFPAYVDIAAERYLNADAPDLCGLLAGWVLSRSAERVRIP